MKELGLLLANIRPEHVAMLLRGALRQIFILRFDFILMMGRGAKFRVDRRVKLKGIIKIDDYADLDIRFTADGTIGPRFSLGKFSIFRASGSSSFTCPTVKVAENVSFGPYCNIGGGFGLTIGANVIGGPYVSIHPEEHSMNADTLVRQQPIFGTGVRIGADCWLSAKSTILDGSNLGIGTVLAANAVVTGKTTDAYGIYAGIPAKILRYRGGV